MSAPIVSFQKKHRGVSLVDGKTLLSFAVGAATGSSGLQPSWAAVCVLGFEALFVVLEKGLGSAFERQTAQSYGNQMVSAMAGILGVYYGESLKAPSNQGVHDVRGNW